MKKLKKMPKFAKEITITVISYIVLCVLWFFFLEEYIVLSDQGLSTIGLALSTSLGVLTAIVVSFVLIVWQTSRRDRSESFLRWRNTLHQIFEFYDTNLEKLMEIREDIMVLTHEASEVASIAPMSLERFRQLTSNILRILTEDAKRVLETRNPTYEQIEKAKLGKYLMDYLVMFTHANFDHNVAHNLYKGLLGLRGLLFRLLGILGISILIVTMTVTATTAAISDLFNTPLVLVLVAWVLYLLFYLGIAIKRFTRLEDEFRRLEAEAK